MRKTHELKILPVHFEGVLSGLKKAEFRLGDRDYEVDDLLILREFNKGKYTGRVLTKSVGHITDLKGYADGYLMLSFK